MSVLTPAGAVRSSRRRTAGLARRQKCIPVFMGQHIVATASNSSQGRALNGSHPRLDARAGGVARLDTLPHVQELAPPRRFRVARPEAFAKGVVRDRAATPFPR